LYDTIETTKIDELAAEQCAALSTKHLDYGTLASRIVISNHQKNTNPKFSAVTNSLFQFKNLSKKHKPLLGEEYVDFVNLHADALDNMISHERDYLIDFFGFKTLERAYLFKINNITVERIQHMWMRVAVGIHGITHLEGPVLELIKETYDLLSLKYFTHATPTLFNAGTPRPQLSSCYLLKIAP
jgi:ribonucleotide reductase alpha subunit